MKETLGTARGQGNVRRNSAGALAGRKGWELHKKLRNMERLL